jgi:hypothetical protein
MLSGLREGDRMNTIKDHYQFISEVTAHFCCGATRASVSRFRIGIASVP